MSGFARIAGLKTHVMMWGLMVSLPTVIRGTSRLLVVAAHFAWADPLGVGALRETRRTGEIDLTWAKFKILSSSTLLSEVR
jgi:hypothetical protein